MSDADLEFGVADEATQHLLKQWLELGLRKPGPIYFRGGRTIWGDISLWTRFAAANALCRALGMAYPLTIGSTLRSIDAGGGEGRSVTSWHKMGMSVDLAMAGSSATSSSMPLAFCADWIVQEPRRKEIPKESTLHKLKAIAEQRESEWNQAYADYQSEKSAIPPDARSLEKRRRAASKAYFAHERAKIDYEAYDAWHQAYLRQTEDQDFSEQLGWELRFILFGHSVLDSYHIAPAELEEQLRPALDPKTGSARNYVHQFFMEKIPEFARPSLAQCDADDTIEEVLSVAQRVGRALCRESLQIFDEAAKTILELAKTKKQYART